MNKNNVRNTIKFTFCFACSYKNTIRTQPELDIHYKAARDSSTSVVLTSMMIPKVELRRVHKDIVATPLTNTIVNSNANVTTINTTKMVESKILRTPGDASAITGGKAAVTACIGSAVGPGPDAEVAFEPKPEAGNEAVLGSKILTTPTIAESNETTQDDDSNDDNDSDDDSDDDTSADDDDDDDIATTTSGTENKASTVETERITSLWNRYTDTPTSSTRQLPLPSQTRDHHKQGRQGPATPGVDVRKNPHDQRGGDAEDRARARGQQCL